MKNLTTITAKIKVSVTVTGVAKKLPPSGITLILGRFLLNIGYSMFCVVERTLVIMIDRIVDFSSFENILVYLFFKYIVARGAHKEFLCFVSMNSYF